jgi:ATP-dependent DNA helicase PIF1
VFGGDFRQVLPVIPRASRAEVVSASLSHSCLWKHMKVMKLSINMRLCQNDDIHENLRQRNFAEFLLKIGDSKYPIVPGTENMIDLPLDMTIPGGELSNLIDFVYPNLIENSSNVSYMVGRAILTPKNDNVENISCLIMSQYPGELHVYPSADSVDLTDDGNMEQPQLYLPEFLRTLRIPGFPPGELKLKVGVPIMLLRNLNPSEGLCNGTRLICHGLYRKVIDAEIITDPHVGSCVFIPRILLHLWTPIFLLF